MVTDKKQRLLNDLFSLQGRGIKYDLARMREACSRLGNPQHGIGTVHVAGTNGKGTVCAFVESILRHAGYTTGLYTSPHIVNFNERFCIDGVPVADADWIAVFERIEPIVGSCVLSFFEYATLIAFVLFKERGVDRMILETGLGGRLDATNVCAPDIVVVTALSLEHCDYLGSTLIDIAREKAGIIKPGARTVLVEPDDPNVRAELIKSCERAGVEPRMVSSSSIIETGTGFCYDTLACTPRLTGAGVLLNGSVAVETGRLCGCSDREIVAGINECFIPGRFDIRESGGRTVVFDVAHNPRAIEGLCEQWHRRFGKTRPVVCLGVMADKQFTQMLPVLAKIAASFVFTRPQTDRALSPEKMADALFKRCTVDVTITTDVPTAVKRCLATPESPILVTGSFFTVGEAMTALGMSPFPSR